MSRSIHDNRSRKALLKRDLSDDDWTDLDKKSQVKESMREDRTRVLTPPHGGISQPTTIPIEFARLASPALCPVTAGDIRNVLRRLPPDSCRGVRGIRLQEWTGPEVRYFALAEYSFPEDVLEFSQARTWFAERVYIPWLQGTFHKRTGWIRLHYYMRATDSRPTPGERALLKSSCLETLVHEVAHAFDYAHRVGRGRWRMDVEERNERYARAREEDWCRIAVWPYVLERMTRSKA